MWTNTSKHMNTECTERKNLFKYQSKCIGKCIFRLYRILLPVFPWFKSMLYPPPKLIRVCVCVRVHVFSVSRATNSGNLFIIVSNSIDWYENDKKCEKSYHVYVWLCYKFRTHLYSHKCMIQAHIQINVQAQHPNCNEEIMK